MSSYFYIFLFNALKVFNYKSEVFLFLLRKAIEVIVLIIFWGLVKDGTKSFTELTVYFLLASGISEITMGYYLEMGNHVKRLVRNGEISNYLIKPLEIIKTLYFLFLGGRVLYIVFAIITVFIALFIQGSVNLNSLLFFFPLLIIAFFIALSLNLIIASLAVGIGHEVADSVIQPLKFFSRLISGAMIPLYFYPEGVRKVLEFLPFSYLVSYPVNILTQTGFDSSIILNIFIGICWAVGLNIVMAIIFKLSLKRYEASGI